MYITVPILNLYTLELQVGLDAVHQTSRVVQLLGLALGQDLAHNVAYTVRSQHTGQRQEHRLIDAVLALHQRGHRMHVVGVPEDGRGQGGHRQSNGPGGVSLQTDHLVGTLHHLLVQILPLLWVTVQAHLGPDLAQTNTGNVHARPHWHRRVTVLTWKCMKQGNNRL